MPLFAHNLISDFVAESLRPKKPMGLVDWVREKRIISSVSSSNAGKYDLTLTPYQIGIFEAIDDPTQPIIVFPKSTQIGATEIMVSVIGHCIDQAPGTIMYVLPNENMCKKFSALRVEPMIAEHDFLRAKIQDVYKKNDTRLSKMFDGGLLSIVPSSSSASIRSLPCSIVILDEYDIYNRLAKEGRVFDIVKGRFGAQKNMKIVLLSSTTIEGASPIWDLFLLSDQRYYHIPCPNCNSFDYFRFSDFKWDGRDASSVRWVCPKCEKSVEENKKQNMMIDGYWCSILPEEERKGKYSGFHISAFYSPLAWEASSWKVIVEQYLEINNNEDKNKTFHNLYLGIPWSPKKAQAPDAKILLSRSETYSRNEVDEDYGCVTVAVDIQGDRFELELLGWKTDGSMRSMSIDYRVIFGESANLYDPMWAELKAIMHEKIRVRGTDRTVPILGMAIDSSFLAQNVYAFCRASKNSKIFAIKGQESLNCAVSSPRQADAYINNVRVQKVSRYWSLGTNILKTEFYGFLNLKKDTNTDELPYGHCRFPQYDLDYFEMLTSEHLILKERANGRMKYTWEKKPNQQRNEALDIRVYQHGLYRLLGLERASTEQWNVFKDKLRRGDL